MTTKSKRSDWRVPRAIALFALSALSALSLVSQGCSSPKQTTTNESVGRELSPNDHLATSAPSKDVDSVRLVNCPSVTKDAAVALDTAEQFFEAADITHALACASLAAELAPQSVAAHHLRGAALAALGEKSDAQVAFAMALALDPDDPETLAAVADYYLSIHQPRNRRQLLLGLEYARRGGDRASIRRRSDQKLRARLLLLEGEALNDLGLAQTAHGRVTAALAISPGWLEAEHELGVTLFNLCRFNEARQAFTKVLAAAPLDAYAHFYVGLIAEYQGDDSTATKHFAKAREMAPREFLPKVTITVTEFSAELDQAISELSPVDAALVGQVSVEVSGLPHLADLTAVEPPFAPTIMGLYRGLPVGLDAGSQEQPSQELEARPIDALARVDGVVPPRAIVLYRRNIARVSSSRGELNRQIRRTLAHEIGHARGRTELELRLEGLE